MNFHTISQVKYLPPSLQPPSPNRSPSPRHRRFSPTPDSRSPRPPSRLPLRPGSAPPMRRMAASPPPRARSSTPSQHRPTSSTRRPFSAAPRPARPQSYSPSPSPPSWSPGPGEADASIDIDEGLERRAAARRERLAATLFEAELANRSLQRRKENAKRRQAEEDDRKRIAEASRMTAQYRASLRATLTARKQARAAAKAAKATGTTSAGSSSSRPAPAAPAPPPPRRLVNPWTKSEGGDGGQSFYKVVEPWVDGGYVCIFDGSTRYHVGEWAVPGHHTAHDSFERAAEEVRSHLNASRDRAILRLVSKPNTRIMRNVSRRDKGLVVVQHPMVMDALDVPPVSVVPQAAVQTER